MQLALSLDRERELGPEVLTPPTSVRDALWERERDFRDFSFPEGRNNVLPGLEVSPHRMHELLQLEREREFEREREIERELARSRFVSQSDLLPSRSSKLLKSQSQKTIPFDDIAAFAQSQLLMQSGAAQYELDREQPISSLSTSPTRFPLMKSKTAPRLQTIPFGSDAAGDVGSTPLHLNTFVDGHDVQFARQQQFLQQQMLHNTPGRPALLREREREREFGLLSEMPDAMLDFLSPSSLSAPAPQQKTPFAQGGFFGETDLRDPRCSWDDASLEEELSLSHQQNQFADLDDQHQALPMHTHNLHRDFHFE